MASCTAVVASDYDLQAHGATVDMVHGFMANATEIHTSKSAMIR
jgi:hypothetical protein